MKKGHWKHFSGNMFYCSECECVRVTMNPNAIKFCENCGAQMCGEAVPEEKALDDERR